MKWKGSFAKEIELNEIECELGILGSSSHPHEKYWRQKVIVESCRSLVERVGIFITTG